MSQITWDLENNKKVGDNSGEEVHDEPQVYSVSKLNSQIRGILEGEFPLVWLQAEISNFTAHSSGHFYFSLKDSKSQISAVMFRGHNAHLKFKPANGMEVLIRGRVTVYEPRGNYQFFCESMEPVGAGALQKAFEQLKAKLQKEGLFERARKKALPEYPKKIGVVTSPTGAAIRDILNILRRRNPGVEVLVIPALVQGSTAAPSIVSAIELAQKVKDLDVLIIGRGGGSTEDMWCFNEESVARAIATSRIPTISSVGHEVDFTIADFVADLRAPTPSAAAELIVKDRVELLEFVSGIHRHLRSLMIHRIQNAKSEIVSLQKRLRDPQRYLQDLMQRNDDLLDRLFRAAIHQIQKKQQRVENLRLQMVNPLKEVEKRSMKVAQLAEKLSRSMEQKVIMYRNQLTAKMQLLDSLSPLRVVERGFSITKKQESIVKDASSLKVGNKVDIQFAKGRATATIDKIFKD